MSRELFFADELPDTGDEVQMISTWRVLRQAGEGAFGLVYEALQEKPVRRKAALKMLKPGLDSREILTRFATEREALALLDHPGIARVLDAGTEAGRPWIASEWVEGAQAVTEYCVEKQLPLADRVRVFHQICEAVAHAHQRGIIHRDLKPSNLLISQDGRARVIDFGIARATEQVLARSTLVTLAGQVLGTPAYMSPEQAAGRGAEADTRSDIYALGAVLYELLAGQPLFPREKLESSSIQETLRMVREDVPVRPSSLNPALRGELEWIILRALEKEPSRRYETAAALGRDLQSWLEGGTVLAAPPSRRYQMRTFLRRHRTAALGVGSFLIALIAGTIGMTLLWMRAQNAAEAEAIQRQRAEGDLWQSLVVTAQRERSSQVAGGAERAMETVRRAASIRPGVELRDEVIAALVKPDFGPARQVSWAGKVPRLRVDPVFHPDLSSACLVKMDGSMQLVDTGTCASLRSFKGLPLAGPGSPIFSRSGKWLTVLDSAPRAALSSGLFLKSTAGRALAGVAGEGFAGRLASVVTTPLSSACNLRIWSVSDGEEIKLPAAPEVLDYLWSADDRVLALLRADSVERLAMPGGHSLGFTRIVPGWRGPSLSGSGTLLAISYDRTVEIREIESGVLRHTLTHQQTVEHCAWNGDDSLLAVGSHDARIHVWDVATGQKWAECNGHDSRPAGQEFLPDSGLLLTGSWDATLRLWSPRTGRPSLVLPFGGDVWVRNSGGTVVSLARWPELSIRRMRSPVALRTATLPARPDDSDVGAQGICFSQDGRVVFTSGTRGICAWETAKLRHLGVMPCAGGAVSVIPGADQSLLLTDDKGVRKVTWELDKEGAAIRFGKLEPAGPGVRCNHADATEDRLAVSCVTELAPYGERVEIWQQGRPVRGWDFHYRADSPDTFAGSWPKLALSPDGGWLAVGATGLCRPLLLRTDTGPLNDSASVRLEKGFFDGAACAFSPDSRTLAVQSLRAISLWDVSSRTRTHVLPRPEGALDYFVTFSPDGRLLAAMGPRRDIWLINPATGERLAALTPPEPMMTGALAFSPDSSLLAVALMKDTIQVWNLREIRGALAAEGLDWH